MGEENIMAKCRTRLTCLSYNYGAAHNAPQEGEGNGVTTGNEDTPRNALSILVAEDETVSRLFLSRILMKLGHEVTSAKNGREVLEILQHNDTFDVLLTDIRMPQLDGIEVSRILRSSKQFRHRLGLPIIAMTALRKQDDKNMYLKAGMDDYLPKPIDGRLLKIILDQVARKLQ